MTLHPARSWVVLWVGLATGALWFPPTGARAGCDDEVRVTVVAIVATDRNADVDPRVKCIAEEVKKLEPGLTGYRVARTTCKAVTIGQKETFALLEDEAATVVVKHGCDKDSRVGLTVKPPQVGEITYETTCGKFFPIVTRYQTRDKDRLIIAVMVRPCTGKR